jgi:hypothetical protein
LFHCFFIFFFVFLFLFLFSFFLPSSLVCGDVGAGKLGALFKRVSNILKKDASFNLLLVCGEFVSGLDSPDLAPYLSGSASIPIMTYFAHGQLEPAMICENLICVGSFGIIKLEELDVAFLWDEDCADIVIQQGESEKLKTEGIDLLISRFWPQGVLTGLPAADLPAGVDQNFGSANVASVCSALAPRYIFAPSTGFVERRPFSQPNHRHVSRFLGLAPVGNAQKNKWMYAFHLRHCEALVATADTTPNPFLMARTPLPAAAAPDGRRVRDEGGASEGFQRWNVQEGGGGGRKKVNFLSFFLLIFDRSSKAEQESNVQRLSRSRMLVLFGLVQL